MGPNQSKLLALKQANPSLTKAQGARALGINKSAVSNMFNRGPGGAALEAAWAAIELGNAPEPEHGDSGVPDFLEWRTMHNAYLDRAQKKVRRAKNFPYQRSWIEQMQSSNRLIMVIHPGAGKTTSIAEYVTWNIMRDRNFRTAVIRANEDEAVKNVAQIGTRLVCDNYHYWMEEMERQGDVPITCPVCAYGGRLGFQTQAHGRNRKIDEKWSASAFVVSGRTSGDKEATAEAYGANSPIAGVRSDLIVLDDAQDPQKFRTTGFPYTEKMFDWFREDVLGRLYDDQKLVVIGNRLGSQDFVGKLIDEYGPEDPENPQPDDWTVAYYPAVLNDETQRILVPELWTYEGLQRKRKEVGEEIWAFQWQQERVNESESTFTRDAMDACKNFDRALGEKPDWVTHTVVGVDPAVSGYCAITALGVSSETGRRALIDFINEKGMKNEDNIAQRTVEFAKQVRAQVIVVEVRNIQQSIFDKIKQLCRGTNIRVIDYKTATATGAQAQETDFDITSIGKIVDDRMIDLPYKLNDAQTQKRMKVFIEQFLLWRPRPPGKSSWHLIRDIVMSVLFAESELRKYVKRAERPERKPHRSRAPAWAKNKGGGWAWRKPA